MEEYFQLGGGVEIEKTVFRVCKKDDHVVKHKVLSTGFTSVCATEDAAKSLMLRPPNPFSNTIYKLVVRGRAQIMTYEGSAGSRKKSEEEYLVPFTSIIECTVHK